MAKEEKEKMNKAKKIILWGMGEGYDSLINSFLFEKEKGNLTIEGIVCRENDIYCKYLDGFEVLSKDDIKRVQFDYIVITTQIYLNEIRASIIASGIEEKRIINGEVFRLPLFDFGRYVKLIENPVTILSDDCWGGYAYHRLGLQFSSPLININWDRDDYSRFILEPEFYLRTDLRMVREGDISRGIYPIGYLGENDKIVKLQLVHNINFDEAYSQWSRRSQRINFKNIFVKMGYGCDVDEEKKQLYFERFDKVTYKKILAYFGNDEVDGMFTSGRFIWRNKSLERVFSFNYNDYFRREYFKDLDLLKLLTGENYSRYDK